MPSGPFRFPGGPRNPRNLMASPNPAGLTVELTATFDVTKERAPEAALPPDLPSISLSALVVLGDKTSEGHLIQLLTPAWSRIVADMLKDSRVMYEITPRQWEELIAGAYKEAGFDEVTLTQRSGDHGRDVIAVKRGIGSVRFLDQVKAYAPDRRVSHDEVMSLYGVLAADLNASKGIVSTTSYFAPRLLEDPRLAAAIPHRLELRDRDTLRPWLATLIRKP